MIEVSHLTKKYGDHTAVSDLSFTIENGRIYGFLGPNGAGKSTTMNIMTGCLAATSGEVKIDGFDIFEEPKQAKKLIGYLPEIPPLYVDQTPREYLNFVARAKGVKKADIKVDVERVIGETHIENVADKLIRHLSKGYKQRVGIAQALLGRPEVIILDEPTVGLDPVQIIEIRDLIKELGQTHTVILSSHILPEVQAICEMVLIINKGKLVAFDKLENLSGGLSSGSAIDLSVDCSAEKAESILRGIYADPEESPITDITVVSDSETSSELKVTLNCTETEAVSRKFFFAFAQNETTILQMTPVRATLEDVFLELTGDDAAVLSTEPEESMTAPEEKTVKKANGLFGHKKTEKDDAEEKNTQKEDE